MENIGTNSAEQRPKSAASQFSKFWKGKGYEKGQTQPFWIGLLRVLGIANPDQGFIEFEDKAHIDAAHGFIDGYIPATRVMVEQKSLGKNLRAAIPQSDGSLLTPFQQAKRYCLDLPLSRHPRWIVTCNFAEFDIYDMEKLNAEPERLLLESLPDELYRLTFLVDTGSDTIRREEEISKKAGDVVGLIYDALLKQYEKCENVASVASSSSQFSIGNIDIGNWQHLHNGNIPNTSTLAHSAMLASLNELCVRLVFLLYAEDAEVFARRQFHDYLARREARDARRALIDLFKVLDTPPDRRDPYLEPELAAFPYVNGGLFANENIEIPQFTDEILDLVLRKGSEDFDWKDISPTIFGAVFESTLNPETRRSGGMHYTSVANIHKAIDPLFLDALTERVEALCKCENVANNQSPIGTGNIGTGNNCTLAQSLSPRQRRDALLALQSELASLTFLDPACGSGNFLTETYVSLRRLENKIIAALMGGQTMLDLSGDMVKVSLSQFHGIEINDFAVKVAKTALWIAENQMLRETEAIAHRNLDFLPLKNYDGIIEGNALRLDWPSLLCQCGNVANPNSQSQLETGTIGTGNIGNNGNAPAFDYIMGNPPFVGLSLRTKEQAAEMDDVYADWKDTNYGKLDYVCAWYKKAADYMTAHPTTRAAFVSTNSIVQGESVATLWEPLFNRAGAEIDFAHRSFRWDSESNSKAHVHVVIVGFHCGPRSGEAERKTLFEGERALHVPHINGYLLAAPDIFIQNRNKPPAGFPKLTQGNKPWDGGNLLLSVEERAAIIAEYPQCDSFIKRYLGAEDFLKNNLRYCLWLLGVSPEQYRGVPEIMRRLAAVAEIRRKTKTVAVQKQADTPMLFSQIRQPDSDYLVVPEVSSQRRRYIPIGFMDKSIIAANTVTTLPNATHFLFGVLSSNVHNAWMRTTAGRLKSDYRYTPAVYNNFPFPTPTDEQKARIAQTAQGILDARAKYPDSSLADLYDELTMPPDLRKAHQENDRAVMAAYGFSTKMTESECVAELFKRYQAIVNAKGANG